MADLKLRYNAASMRYDLVRGPDGDLVLDPGPRTAAICAVLSWRRAQEGDPLPGFSGDVKGHWADPWDPRKTKGSRCWLLNGRIITTRTLSDAEGYLRQALQQLVTDGWVTAVDPTVWRSGPTTTAATVRLPLADGKEDTVEFDTLTG